MTTFHQIQFKTATRFSSVPSFSEKSQITKVRMCIYIPNSYLKEPVISRLISHHGLVVNIISAMLGSTTGGEGRFDLEIRGTLSQISSGLNYLESLNLKIVGKPNVDGDSWSY
ncbi:NIL domain-containing protein [Nostoc linckia FACHB-104]|nr:NIL domain-containing protein [Nostoc linckia FACHB-104]